MTCILREKTEYGTILREKNCTKTSLKQQQNSQNSDHNRSSTVLFCFFDFRNRQNSIWEDCFIFLSVTLCQLSNYLTQPPDPRDPNIHTHVTFGAMRLKLIKILKKEILRLNHMELLIFDQFTEHKGQLSVFLQ